jgi:molybdopterin-guanine dinucleotide biosynthesis protein A
MNQTGVASTGSLRHARTKRDRTIEESTAGSFAKGQSSYKRAAPTTFGPSSPTTGADSVPGMDGIVPAGGAGARMGNADKAALRIGGRTSLDRVLAALADAGRIVVVGEERTTSRAVEWTREEPVGGGPVAAIATGLRTVTAETVAVVAADMPLLERRHIAVLRDAASGHDGAIFVDAGGRDQPLAGVYRLGALRDALGRLSETNGASVHAFVRDLDLARIVDDRAAMDCDTPEDVERAERMLLGGESSVR